MQRPTRLIRAALLAAAALMIGASTAPVGAQSGPAVLDPNLGVRTVVSGLITPSTMAFLGPNDFFVLEKNTGAVKRIVNGAVQATVLHRHRPQLPRPAPTVLGSTRRSGSACAQA